jgi:predicted nucleic acid-binding protein
MILVDTSIWKDHLHKAEPGLVAHLETGLVAQHPMIVGELALGSLRDRDLVLGLLAALPQVRVATQEDVMRLVDGERLYGNGLSLVDAHLLTSLRLAPDTSLWTRDKRLRAAAVRLGIGVRDA